MKRLPALLSLSAAFFMLAALIGVSWAGSISVCTWEGELTDEDIATLSEAWGIQPEIRLRQSGNDIRLSAGRKRMDPSKHFDHPLCDIGLWFARPDPVHVVSNILFVGAAGVAYCHPDYPGKASIVIYYRWWGRDILRHEARHALDMMAECKPGSHGRLTGYRVIPEGER